jgi:exosome complex RNA-binding protein Rrp42 (RNase PH superfamily)
MGNTAVVCGVKAEVAEPKVTTPNEGYIGIKLHYLFYGELGNESLDLVS